MIDFHCHLDLYPKPQEIVEECKRRGIYVLSMTTTPTAWHGTSALSRDVEHIQTALGLHPQLAGQRRHELPLFDKLINDTKFVGEVGLDGGDEFKSTWNDQLEVFSHILTRCAQEGGRVISIHSRRATSRVLDCIEMAQDCGIPILHWFSGTRKELERAISMGCWFSVGPAMVSSKKGSEIAACLPRDRVLTETDGPFAQWKGRSLNPWEAGFAVATLAAIWNVPETAAENGLQDNLRRLVSCH